MNSLNLKMFFVHELSFLYWIRVTNLAQRRHRVNIDRKNNVFSKFYQKNFGKFTLGSYWGLICECYKKYIFKKVDPIVEQ